MRSAGWNLLGISFVMLTSNIILYILLNIADLFRPSKKYHVDVGGEGGIGCIGSIATFVPVLLMTDIVSDMINKSKYLSFLDIPSYDGEWYITLLIWILWYCNFWITVAIMDNPSELRLLYYLTPQEKIIEKEEKEKQLIRIELRKEEEQRKKD